MIDYFYVGGQLFAEVRRIAPGVVWSIWNVAWGDTAIMPARERHWVPEDVQ